MHDEASVRRTNVAFPPDALQDGSRDAAGP